MAESEQRKKKRRFDRNWNRWMMESANRWDDLADVITRTGIDKVDDDHRVLIEYAIEFNKLYEIAENDELSLEFIDTLEELFLQLSGFTKEHFKREQELISRFKIPGIGRQRHEHRRILRMLDDYMTEIKSGRLNIAYKFKSTFMEWLKDHINGIDYETFRLDKIAPIIIKKAKDWRDTSELVCSMGLHEIDQDHQRITRLILEMDQLVLSDEFDLLTDVPDPLIDLLNQLQTTSREHFIREERLIAKFDLKDGKQQKADHQWFLNELEKTVSDLKKGESFNLTSIRNGILEWWIRHINVHDYISFKEDNWLDKALSKAETLEDVEELVQPTGIGSIDEQHRTQLGYILSLSKQLALVTENRHDSKIVRDILEKLEKIYRFADKHFSHEESIMYDMKIQGLAEHQSEHWALRQTIREYIDNLKSGKFLLSMNLRTLLASWWTNHINKTDYGTFNRVSDD